MDDLTLTDPPQPPDKVFTLATPAHMLMKLSWEIDRLREALSEPPEKIGYMHAPAYHAFNCAVTAWHLHDWVWESIDKDGRAELFESLGAAPAGGLTAFGKALMRYPALRICRQIATGSKHKIVRGKHVDPAVIAQTDWTIKRARAGEARCGDRLATYQCALSIRDGDRTWPAVQVFEEALATWEQLLARWGFVEGPMLGRSIPARYR